MPLVLDSQNLAVDALLGNVVYRQVYTWHTSDGKKSYPRVFKANSNYFKEVEVNSIIADDTVFIGNTHPHLDASSDKLNLCRVASHITIPAYTQAAVLVSCRGDELMKIETHHIIVER